MEKYNRITIGLLFFILCIILLSSCTDKKMPSDVASLYKLKSDKQLKIKLIEKEIIKIDSLLGIQTPDLEEKDYRLVTLDTIYKGTFERFLEVQGSVYADDELMVSSEIGGRIIYSPIKEGQFIKKGALVAKLDMESVSKQRAEIEKSLELAKQVFNKQARLWENKIGSELQYLEAKNAKERLEKSLETVDHQLTKANVYSPLTGEVDVVFAESGETVGPGSPIAKILNTRNLKVKVDAPETFLRSIQKGAKVTVKIPALDFEKDLRISRIGSSINPVNRTFSIEVNISNTSGLIKPNLLSTMLIKDYSADQVLTVPVNLVQQEVGGKEFIMIAQQKGDELVAQKKYVTTGEQYENMIVIEEGLEDGWKIIIHGARNVSNDDYLKVSG